MCFWFALLVTHWLNASERLTLQVRDCPQAERPLGILVFFLIGMAFAVAQKVCLKRVFKIRF